MSESSRRETTALEGGFTVEPPVLHVEFLKASLKVHVEKRKTKGEQHVRPHHPFNKEGTQQSRLGLPCPRTLVLVASPPPNNAVQVPNPYKPATGARAEPFPAPRHMT